MRVHLDLKATRPGVVGPRDGVPASRLAARRGRLHALHAQLEEAEAAGLLPHLAAAERVTDAVALGAGWRTRGRWGDDRLVVLGEPAAVAAALALSAPAADLRVVDQPDPGALADALDGAKRPRLLTLPGPGWVEEAVARAREAASSAARTAVVEPDGPRPDAEEHLDGAGDADPRFGAVGAAALAVAGWQGGDAARLASVLDKAVARGRRTGLRENPSLRLAALAAALADDGRVAPALILPGRSLAGWGRWARGAWAALTSRAVPAEAGDLRRGAAPLCVAAGDEALAQHLLAGPRDRWAVVLRPAPGADPFRARARELVDAHLAQLGQARIPAAVVELHDDRAETLAALSWLWLHAALVTAALDPVDPLTMDAADDLRRRLGQPLPGDGAA